MAATLEQKPGPKGCCPCSKTNLFLHAVNLVFFVSCDKLLGGEVSLFVCFRRF